MSEESVRQFLTEITLDVPLARGEAEGSRRHLDALRRAASFYPVFLNWPGPVPSWCNELAMVARVRNDAENLAVAQLRLATVQMRVEGPEAGAIEMGKWDLAPASEAPRYRRWAATVRARIAVRSQDFEAAARHLAEARSIPIDADDWVPVLADAADAELTLERGDLTAALPAFTALEAALPEFLVEEKVQALQSLGFLHIARADMNAAYPFLDGARRICRGAAAWPEVLQMSLVLAGFELARGNLRAAERLEREAIEISRAHPLPAFEPILEATNARLEAAKGNVEAAAQAALRAAGAFARAGNPAGYAGMVGYLAAIRTEAGQYEEAYQILALGLSAAKHLRLPFAETIFRAQIDRLRGEVLGPERFDAMVQSMLKRN